MGTKIIHYLDELFVMVKGHGRYPKNLQLTLTSRDGVVRLAFSDGDRPLRLAFNEAVIDFPLLPDEALQLSESLKQMSEEARGRNEDEEDDEEETTVPDRPSQG